MTKRFNPWVAIALFLSCPDIPIAQNLPVLNRGFSGGGVGADLLKVTGKAS